VLKLLKKAGTVVAVMTGLMMVGAPAFAVTGEPNEHSGHGLGHAGDDYTAIGELHNQYYEDGEGGDHVEQFGLVNFAEDSDVLSNINICEVEVNVIGIPVLAQNDEAVCINTDNDDN
jgi:hypothetical protein